VVGKGAGKLQSIEVVDDEAERNKDTGGVMNLFKGLVSGKTLSPDDISPALDKLKDHLISKNVAADVSAKLCESVANKLHGKVK